MRLYRIKNPTAFDSAPEVAMDVHFADRRNGEFPYYCRSFCRSSFWNPRRVVTVTSRSATSCLIHSASAPRGRWMKPGGRWRQAWRR